MNCELLVVVQSGMHHMVSDKISITVKPQICNEYPEILFTSPETKGLFKIMLNHALILLTWIAMTFPPITTILTAADMSSYAVWSDNNHTNTI